MRLTDRSPAINAGSNLLAVDAAGNPLIADLVGNPRIADGAVDIGAYEYQGAPAPQETPSLVVSTTDDEFDLYDGEITLREAIYYSKSGIGDGTVTFDAALDSATITLAGSALLIDHSMEIDASALSSLTVNADNRSGVFYITDNVSLSHLTLTGGSAIFGGGIYNDSGTLTVTNCTLSGNSADQGGAIFTYGTLTLLDSMVAGSSAIEGGGIYNYLGTLTVTNSTISGNSATMDGGGLYNNYGTLTLTNSTISGNTAGEDGGGIHTYAGRLIVTDSIISSNSTGGHGGGIYSSGTLTVTNSTLSGNSACGDGGGIYSHSIYGTLTVSNSILSWNAATNDPDCYGTLTPEGSNNLIGTDPLFVRNPSDGGDGWGDDPATLDIDESLNDDYGDLRLMLGSPAIDMGSNDLALDPDGNPLTTDILGNVRIQNGTVDMGAYEYDTISPEVANVVIGNGTTQRSIVKTLRIEFSEDVFGSLSTEHLHLHNLTTGEVVAAADMALHEDADTLTATWTFPGLSDSKLPEGNYVATLEAEGVQDDVGNPMAEDYVFEFHVFPGDATGDGEVNSFDLLKVRQNYLKPPGMDRDDCADVTGDGAVNAFDLLLVRQNYLETLEPPAETLAPATQVTVPALAATPETSEISCDLDNDGMVGLGDLSLFASVYREKPGITTDSPLAYAADFDGSGTVDLGDLSLFAASYRQPQPSDSTADPVETSPPVSSAPTMASALADTPATSSDNTNVDNTPSDDNITLLAHHWAMNTEDPDDDDDVRDAVFAEVGAANDPYGLFEE